MLEMSNLQLAIIFAAAIVAIVIVLPYVPLWAAFVVGVGMSFYWVVRIVLDGPSAPRVVSLALFSASSFYLWWRRLRGTGGEGRPAGP